MTMYDTRRSPFTCHPKAVWVLSVKKRQQFVMEALNLSPCGLFPSLRHSLSPLGFHYLLCPPKSDVLVSHGQTEAGDTMRGVWTSGISLPNAPQSGSVAVFLLLLPRNGFIS